LADLFGMAPSTDPDAIKMEQALEEDRLETVAAIKELAKQKSINFQS